MAAERSPKAYFRGNGTNVLKNVPETALKLTLNDRIKSLVAQDGHQMRLCECLAGKAFVWHQSAGCLLCSIEGTSQIDNQRASMCASLQKAGAVTALCVLWAVSLAACLCMFTSDRLNPRCGIGVVRGLG